MAVTLEQAVGQLVQLGDALANVRKDVGSLQSENIELRQQLRDLRVQPGAPGSRHDKSELRSMKAMYPEKFDPKSDNFKSWCEDFERWIKSEDEDLADLFRQAATAKDAAQVRRVQAVPTTRRLRRGA